MPVEELCDKPACAPNGPHTRIECNTIQQQKAAKGFNKNVFYVCNKSTTKRFPLLNLAKQEQYQNQTAAGSSSSQQQHQQTYSDYQKRPHVCGVCDARFGTKAHLDTHSKTVHCKEKPFTCDQCDYVSASKSTLEKHVHLGEGQHVCEICNSCLIGLFPVHEKVKKFDCQFCRKKFGQKAHLSVHINSVHIQARNFKCEECAYKSTTKGMLEKHVKTVHRKEKPFECDLCPSKFGQKGTPSAFFKPFSYSLYTVFFQAHLQKHRLSIHAESKPYACDKCDFHAVLKADLERHFKSVHMGLKPFQCQVCR